MRNAPGGEQKDTDDSVLKSSDQKASFRGWGLAVWGHFVQALLFVLGLKNRVDD